MKTGKNNETKYSVPLVWAHRGARSAAPENTMAAARAAKAQGAYGWELDVHLTQDGQVIVAHDHGLRRTTDIARVPDMPPRKYQVVNRLTLEQVRKLDAGSWFARRDPFGTIAAGAVTPQELESYRAEIVPTLTEALDWTRESGLQINVEIKDMLGGDDDGLVRAVIDLLRSSGMAERVLVSSFRAASLELVHELCPEIPIGLLLDEKALHASTASIITRLKELEAKALHPSMRGLYPGRIAEIRAAGFDVNVYTVNREEDIHQLAIEGASGIITDFPARAQTVLKRMGFPRP